MTRHLRAAGAIKTLKPGSGSRTPSSTSLPGMTSRKRSGTIADRTTYPSLSGWTRLLNSNSAKSFRQNFARAIARIFQHQHTPLHWLKPYKAPSFTWTGGGMANKSLPKRKLYPVRSLVCVATSTNPLKVAHHVHWKSSGNYPARSFPRLMSRTITHCTSVPSAGAGYNRRLECHWTCSSVIYPTIRIIVCPSGAG